jgi:hypothetical protein
LIPVARRLLEVADAFADTPPDIRQPVGAENHDDDDQNDDEFWKPKAAHG